MKNMYKYIFVIIVLFLALFYFGFSLYVANKMTSPPSTFTSKVDISPKLISENYEGVEFEATDGVKLRGWFFKNQSDKLIILVGGLGVSRVNMDYFSVELAKELLSQKYNVLMYDTRSTGESQKTRVGFGSTEGRDIVGAVKFANDKGFKDKKIGIIADSFGTASTLIVIDDLKDVGAIVLDTPASKPQQIVSGVLWNERRVPPIFHPTIFLFNKIFFGSDVAQVRPLDKVKLVSERKFLILHAAKDTTIPLKYSQLLLDNANKQSRLVVFEKGEHIGTYRNDPDLYRKEVLGFLEKELGR